METILNLIWILLAVTVGGLWLRHGPRDRAGRRTQIAAVVMLILILFPVISVSDDLQAALNLAEEDAYLRRSMTGAGQHSTSPVIAMLPPSALTEIPFVFSRLSAPGYFPMPIVDYPALSAIQNRPPPTA